MEQPYGYEYECAPERKHSGFGIASFLLSLLSSLGLGVLLVVAAVMETQSGGMDEESLEAVLLGLLLLGGILAQVAAFFLGLGAMFQANRKKLFGIMGMGCAGTTLIALIGLILLGLLVS